MLEKLCSTFAFSLIVAACACKSTSDKPSPPRVEGESAVADSEGSAHATRDAKPSSSSKHARPPAATTGRFIPPELGGVRLGMSLREFQAARDTRKMKVTMALDVSRIPKFEENDPSRPIPEKLKEFGEELDEFERALDGTKDPNYDPTRGRYELEERWEVATVRKATYSFRDGVLRQVLAYYASDAVAAKVAQKLFAGQPKEGKFWMLRTNGDPARQRGWVYQDRVVVADEIIFAPVAPQAGGDPSASK